VGELRSRINLNGQQPRRSLHDPAEKQNVFSRGLTNPTHRTRAHPFDLARKSPKDTQGLLPKMPKPFSIREKPNTAYLKRGLVKDERV